MLSLGLQWPRGCQHLTGFSSEIITVYGLWTHKDCQINLLWFYYEAEVLTWPIIERHQFVGPVSIIIITVITLLFCNSDFGVKKMKLGVVVERMKTPESDIWVRQTYISVGAVSDELGVNGTVRRQQRFVFVFANREKRARESDRERERASPACYYSTATPAGDRSKRVHGQKERCLLAAH